MGMFPLVSIERLISMDLFDCLTAIGEGYRIRCLISSVPASLTRGLEFDIQLFTLHFLSRLP